MENGWLQTFSFLFLKGKKCFLVCRPLELVDLNVADLLSSIGSRFHVHQRIEQNKVLDVFVSLCVDTMHFQINLHPRHKSD